MSNIIDTSIVKEKISYLYSKYSQLTSQSIINFVAQILINLFNIILFFYISKVFTNNELSIFLYVTAICRIFSFLFDGGFNQLILSEFKKSEFRKSLIKIFFLRQLLSILISFTMYYVFVYFNFLSVSELNIFIFLIIFYLNNENLNFFFSILMNLNKNIFIVYSRIMFLLCCFIIFFIDLSFFQIIIYLTLSNFIPLLFVFIISKRFLKQENIKINNLSTNEIIKVFLFYSSFLILAKGIGEINSNVDMIFMKNLTDNFYTSLYGLIIKINQISLIPHMLLGSMILPYFASMRGTSEINKNFFELRFIHILCIYFFSVIILPIPIFFENKLVQFDFNLINLQTILILNIIICFLISLHFHLQQIIIVNRRYYELFIISLFSLILNIFFNFYLIKKINIYGAMFSSIISHLFIYCSYIFLNYGKQSFLINDMKKYGFLLIILILNLFASIFSQEIFFLCFIISNLIILIIYIYNFVNKPLIIK